MPFDGLGRSYGVGRDRMLSLQIAWRYAEEAERFMHDMDNEGLLPPEYDRTMLPQLMDSLDSLGGQDAIPYKPVFD